MKRLMMLVAAICLTLLSSSKFAFADSGTPDLMVKNTVLEVVAVVKQGNKDNKKVQVLIDEKILPLFDFTLMTKRAVGQSWKSATAEQKKMLVDEFRNLMVRVFIEKAFTGNTNFSVKFEPGSYVEGDDQTTVKTQIISPGDAPVAIDYDMKKTSSGWKVVDLAIAGPRLALDIYSNQFQDPLKQSGIDGLIKFLGDKNHSAAAGSAKTSVH